jgi:hypothetical protein
MEEELRRSMRTEVCPSVPVEVSGEYSASASPGAKFSNDAERGPGELGERRKFADAL